MTLVRYILARGGEILSYLCVEAKKQRAAAIAIAAHQSAIRRSRHFDT